jgi:hypothetical protein
MPDCHLVPARLTHVGWLATNMREIDRIECEALGRSGKDALRSGLRCSLSAYTAMEGGRPLAMLGVVPVDLLSGRGVVWMLGTEDVYRHGRALLTLCPLVIGDWLETFRLLDNIISADNHRAIRLLKRLGFTVSDEAQAHGGVEFVSFRIERAAIQEQRLVA